MDSQVSEFVCDAHLFESSGVGGTEIGRRNGLSPIACSASTRHGSLSRKHRSVGRGGSGSSGAHLDTKLREPNTRKSPMVCRRIGTARSQDVSERGKLCAC